MAVRAESRAPATGEVPVGSSAVLIRGRNPQRAAVLISNPGSVVLYIGFNAQVEVGTGFPLPPGCLMGYDGVAEIYAIAPDPTTVGFVEENQG